jgi:hypothetical protein|tara:strand:+ start:1496 stop:1819 length:324 start_codon:yes stop_codon:yes gene_type:complete
MNNIKLNYALIFAMVLQAIGLIWYVSKLDSKVETVYKFYEEESQKSVVVTQAKMQFDLERVVIDIKDIKKELTQGRNKSKKIIRQHDRIFKMLKNKKGGQSPQQYGY